MRLTVVLLLAVVLMRIAHADTYDWAYTVSGDPRVSPIQVFDNGKRTWLQLQQLDPQPAIFAVTTAGQTMLPARREGQMLVVDRVERQLAIVLGAARASVRYVGKGSRDDPPAMFGAATPVKEGGAAPTPVPADRVIAAHQASVSAQETAVSPSAPMNSAATSGGSVSGTGAAGIAPAEKDKSEASEKAVATEKGTSTTATTEQYTVPFAKGTYVLGPLGLRAMTQVATEGPTTTFKILARGDARPINVNGPDGKGMSLAMARAMTMRQFLLQHGIPGSAISVDPDNSPNTNRDGTVFNSAVVSTGHARVATEAPLAKRDTAPSRPPHPATDVKASKPVWVMRASDRLVSETLKRWAAETDWKVSWEAPRDFTAVDGEYVGSFEDAVTQVVLGLSESDSPVRVRFVDDGRNHTARILRYQGNSVAASMGGHNE